ncbi:LysR family transcriptional regulator [Aquincola sp. S2]|uniref:LysR family transcriptional regulator n=1 Tax=Pseudaquabacterium terrae TaxID=2732868 RepID=A0ABX2E9D2_9BURK|nr:LysR family transcriptional regulator [Aquabacterium terrae]NRF65599.1 LysR family transcriptional regulator [Aquabacterium terrae]
MDQLLNEMVVFARVVELRGFAPAARALGLTTSAVSRSVARLEAALAVKLLNRTTRSVSLTELGAEVYPGCARIAQTARDVQALAGRYALTPRGRVRVGAPAVFGEVWLAPRLPAFLARWPEVEVELTLIDRVVDLVDEGYDLALRILAPSALAPGLVARRLFDMHYVLVAAPAYLQANGAPATPDALAEHRCIYLGYGPFLDRLLFERDGAAPLEVQVRGPLTINNSVGILATVEAGLGIGIVPDFAAAAGLRAGRLQRLFADWRLGGGYATRGVFAVYAPTRHLPQKVRVLIDHLAGGAAPDG